ncbi:protein indeterminate-domain 12-like isoform X2 [Salvia splendens]|nr:protein indeterminate-domain 12-like isoform X2 [Salvia splendens]
MRKTTMFPMVIPNSSEEGTNSSRIHQSDLGTLNSMLQNSNAIATPQLKIKKKRNLPGNPDPDAEVIALSPKTLMTANRFVCEICNKGFQRDQNLQLHRRGHNLPWKLKQRSSKENRKRAYVCPEPSCLHHHPSRALGDLTGIKKHYCRKHGEKKWKCDKCSKIYAVQSDWKAHSKTCGTREYRCDCGTLFSRKDSFITHRAFCDALAEESARLSAATNSILPQQNPNFSTTTQSYLFSPQNLLPFRNPWGGPLPQNPNPINLSSPLYQENRSLIISSSPFGNFQAGAAPLSATALLQKAATMGATGNVGSTMAHLDMHKTGDGLTRDFLGLTGDQCSGGGMRELQLPLMKVSGFERDHNSLLKNHGFGFTETCSGWGNC